MMEKRHQLEKLQLEETAKVMLKGAKKSAKAQIEHQIIQMQYDLKAKHMEEEDDFDNGVNSSDVCDIVETVVETEIVESPIAVADSGESKKAKAKRKQVVSHGCGLILPLTTMFNRIRKLKKKLTVN